VPGRSELVIDLTARASCAPRCLATRLHVDDDREHDDDLTRGRRLVRTPLAPTPCRPACSRPWSGRRWLRVALR